MEQIISPIDKQLIIEEIQSGFLKKTQKAHNEIYIINGHNAPNTLKEIGRLRELSFRNSGGGTGKSYDIDNYDLLPKPFEQLIVWNPDKQEIIGGYRFLCGKDMARDEKGIIQMPLEHLFHFSDNYIDNYLPYTIELGRAFVQPKYQSYKGGLKSLYALENLWDGIGAMIGTLDNIKYLVGKVTIYPDMQIETRYAIEFFLRHFYIDKDNLIVPKTEDIIPKNFEDFFKNLFSADNISTNFKILQTYLKERNEKVPPLIKAYIELAHTMRSFGTCLDTHFGNIYDTGIMIAIDDIHKSKQERYMSFYLKKQATLNIVSNQLKQ